jgi:hypothetical protein
MDGVLQVLGWIADVVGLLDFVSPLHWWREWRETANPVALLFALGSGAFWLTCLVLILSAVLESP